MLQVLKIGVPAERGLVGVEYKLTAMGLFDSVVVEYDWAGCSLMGVGLLRLELGLTKS